MGLFDFFSSENGPCSSCEHKSGGDCERFYKEKYDRVNGTTRTYDSCSEARSSSGFCGHKGKYWEKRKPEYDYSNNSSLYKDDDPNSSGPY